MNVENVEKSNYAKILAKLAIFFSLTSSGLVLFSIIGISVSPIRIIGVLAVVYSIGIVLKNPRTELYNCYLLILLTYIVVITLVFSIDLVNEAKLLPDYICVIALFRLIVFSCKTRKDFEEYLSIYMLALGITCVICVYEWFTGNHITYNYSDYGYNEEVLRYLAKAPTAFLYNPNNIGVLMIMSLPVVFLFISILPNSMTFKKKKFYFILNYLLLLLIAIVILMTGSRGALTGGIILYGLYWISSNIPVRKKIFIFFCVFVLLYLGMNFIYTQLDYGGMLENGKISIFGEGDGGRLEIISSIVDYIASEYFLFGIGAGGTTLLIHMSPHNFIMEALGDFGIIGLSLFLVGLIALIKEAINLKRNRGIVLLMIMSFMLSIAIPPTLFTLYFVWVLFAFMYSYMRLEKYGEIE